MKRKSIVMQTVWRISVFFIILIVVLSLGFTFFISTYMKNSILKAKNVQVKTVSNVYERKLDSIMGPIISLAEYTPTIRLVSGYYTEYTSQWMAAIRDVDAYLQNANMFSNYIMDINLIDLDSYCSYSLNDLLRKDYPYCDEEWFQQALKREGIVKYAPPHGKDHLYRDNVGETFSMIYPVKNAHSVCGYIVIECSLFGVADFLAEPADRSEVYLLVDADQNIIYPKTESIIPNALKNVLEQAEGQVTYEGRNIYIADICELNGWKIVLKMNQDFIWKPIYRLVFSIVLVMIFALFFLILISMRNAKKVKHPFDVLINRINSYDGSASREILEYDNAPLEVAVIGERFERMADKMNDLIQDVYVAELEKKEAELEALMNQINPHFLYNVFQLIQTKAVLADNREIEDMIQALSQMMRYTMERKVDKVCVREELEYIKNYLMFYKRRFPNLFDYELDCPKEFEDYRIIKFVLQPVVENCFKHAFDRRKSGGILKITMREKEGDLIIEVYDNGKGMTRERLNEVSQRLGSNKYDGGIGIVNTNARLKLSYGEAYGLHFESEKDQYTRVTIYMRIEEA